MIRALVSIFLTGIVYTLLLTNSGIMIYIARIWEIVVNKVWLSNFLTNCLLATIPFLIYYILGRLDHTSR